MRFRVAIAAIASLLVIFSWGRSVAWAAEVRAETGVRRVAVGETFVIQLTAILDDGDGGAKDPQLPVQGEAQVSAASISSGRRIVMLNFDIRTETNVVASYEITPTGPGRLVLGPGSFLVDGRRLKADALTVEVVEGPPQGPRSRTLRSPFGFGQDPFDQDPFDRDPSGPGSGQAPSGRDLFDSLRRRSGLSAYPDAPAELALESAPNKVGFLVAKLGQPTAVLGEPVVLSIYAYGGRGSFREFSPTEAALADFLSYPSVETSHEQPYFRTEIAGQEFLVVKLREYVLVPLRTGELEIGSMRAVLRGRGYPSQGSPLGHAAVSAPLHLTVREPPASDRPPGYRLGDVGRFELTADVSPRAIGQDEFFTVKLELSGRGNLPSSLDMPDVPGVVWGEPTVRGGVEVDDRELAGRRVMEFTARAKDAGSIELGTVALPHFDPNTKQYRVASAPLGAISVTPAVRPQVSPPASVAPSAEADGRALLLGFSPRTGLSGWRQSRSSPSMGALTAAAAAPVGVWLLLLLPGAFSALRRRRAGRRAKPGELELSSLAAIPADADIVEIAGQLEQLLYRLVEDKTQLRARAILKQHLATRLQQAGLEHQLAADVEALLLALESARFAAAGTPTKDPQLVASARSVLQRLGKAPQVKEKPS
jgi:hypothetical protein